MSHRRTARLLITGFALALVACGSDKSAAPADASPRAPDSDEPLTDAGMPADDAARDTGSVDGGDTDAEPRDGGSSDAGRDLSVRVLDFDPTGNGDPASLYWNDGEQYLLIADQRGNRVWKWTDADGFTLLGTTSGEPADPTGQGRDDVGQITELPDGKIAVARFGFGSFGSVLWLDPKTGEKGSYSGLSATRRRITLYQSDAGVTYGGYFENVPDAGLRGAITTLSLADGERDYATGFAKPVGLLALRDELLAVDQPKNAIVRLPLGPLDGGILPPDGGYPVYARVPAPDQLAYGPDDSLFTGQFRPLDDGGTLAVRQVFKDGGVSVFADELTRPSGLAYDPSGRRLFVADSNGQNVRTIRIHPVP
jgi:sugar lactone lactonase YvrE